MPLTETIFPICHALGQRACNWKTSPWLNTHSSWESRRLIPTDQNEEKQRSTFTQRNMMRAPRTRSWGVPALFLLSFEPHFSNVSCLSIKTKVCLHQQGVSFFDFLFLSLSLTLSLPTSALSRELANVCLPLLSCRCVTLLLLILQGSSHAIDHVDNKTCHDVDVSRERRKGPYVFCILNHS